MQLLVPARVSQPSCCTQGMDVTDPNASLHHSWVQGSSHTGTDPVHETNIGDSQRPRWMLTLQYSFENWIKSAR